MIPGRLGASRGAFVMLPGDNALLLFDRVLDVGSVLVDQKAEWEAYYPTLTFWTHPIDRAFTFYAEALDFHFFFATSPELLADPTVPTHALVNVNGITFLRFFVNESEDVTTLYY